MLPSLFTSWSTLSYDYGTMHFFTSCLQALRAMPVVDLETPTLCLVGAPNVGKSSLVRLLSTGKPEVGIQTLNGLVIRLHKLDSYTL